MDRSEKIKQLQSIQEGKLRPLNLINGGLWCWMLKEGIYTCGVFNFEHLKFNYKQWMKFCENGGHPMVFVKTYSIMGATVQGGGRNSKLPSGKLGKMPVNELNFPAGGERGNQYTGGKVGNSNLAKMPVSKEESLAARLIAEDLSEILAIPITEAMKILVDVHRNKIIEAGMKQVNKT